MTVSPSTIPCLEVAEKPSETNIPLNTCSRIPTHRHDGASLSLAETRRQLHIDIALHIAHIRALMLLEDEVAL